MILVGDYIMICNDSNDLYQTGERKSYGRNQWVWPCGL